MQFNLNKAATQLPVWLHRIVYLVLAYYSVSFLWRSHTFAVLSGLIIFSALSVIFILCFVLTFKLSASARVIIAAVDVLIPVLLFGAMMMLHIMRSEGLLDLLILPIMPGIPIIFALSLFLREDGRLHFTQ